jgi:ABC-type glycerol-3-phosphate transport system permease component
MTLRLPTLELRNTAWMLGGIVVTLCLFGALWFFVSHLVNLEEAATESWVVMISGLGWMVCPLVWWKTRPPQSRLHAVFFVLLCALVVALAGTALGFIGLLFHGVLFDRRELRGYSLLFSVLLIVQLILAVPSAALMQQLVLRRIRSAPELPG